MEDEREGFVVVGGGSGTPPAEDEGGREVEEGRFCGALEVVDIVGVVGRVVGGWCVGSRTVLWWWWWWLERRES